MTRVALVTDSTCNLGPELLAKHHIHTVPLYIIWGDDNFKDGVDLLPPEFYERLRASDDIPKTSQASPQDFVDAFLTVREKYEADEIVCPVVSSILSGTYASAMQAKDTVDFPVHVLDTRQVSWALGFSLLAGVEARDAGASAEDIGRAIMEAAGRTQLLFTINSLEYLRKGGRIGNARLFLGSALNIKPVLTLREGVVESVDNVRTRKRAVEHMLHVVEQTTSGRAVRRLAIFHGDAADEAQALLDAAVGKFQPAESYLSYAAAVLGVHTGPGALGVVVEWDN